MTQTTPRRDPYWMRHRPRPTGGPRHIIRLIVLVAMVGVLVQGAAKQRFYEPFFATPPPPETDPLATTGDGTTAFRRGPNGGAPQSAPERFVLVPTNDNAESVSQPAIETRVRASELVATLDSAKARAAVLHAARGGSFGSGEGPDLDRLDEFARDFSDADAALKDALWRRAFDDVEDGRVWQANDRNALDALLIHFGRVNEASLRSGLHHGRVNTLPLLQQPEVYRGRRVSVAGRPARVQTQARVARAGDEDDDGGSDDMNYAEIWLRPSDGADRPILAIVPSLSGEAARALQAFDANSPPLVIDGVYLKRLAFESGIGADLAPVVVGRLRLASAESQRFSDAAGVQRRVSASQWLVALVGTALVGIGLAAWLFHRGVRRDRAIRRRGSEVLSLGPIADGVHSTGDES